VGLIAGGRETLVRSREGVEDNVADARETVRKHKIGRRDLLIALAASRRTPYTRAAIAEARRRHAKTVFICTNPKGARSIPCDVVIAPDVGPEVVAGSTRMKAGTAQKLILNMLSTTALVRSGATYHNRMVDLQARSEKLRARSLKLVMDLADLSAEDAALQREAAGGRVKTALLMSWQGLDRRSADRKITAAGGKLRRALGTKKPTDR
jgi:N-acetylmuramic acid 6-phosphate etherase